MENIFYKASAQLLKLSEIYYKIVWQNEKKKIKEFYIINSQHSNQNEENIFYKRLQHEQILSNHIL